MRQIYFTLLLIFSVHLSFGQTYIESDPFVKWKAVANGLSYSSITIEPGNGYLLSNNIDKKTEFVIKVKDPKGFTEVDGLVYFGTSLTVIDLDVDTVIFEAKDLYQDELDGFEPEYLSNLTVDFTADVQTNNMLIKVVFFDKNSSSTIALECPFHLVASSDISSNLSGYMQWENQPTYCIIGQSVGVAGSYLSDANGKITSLNFTSKKGLSFKTNLDNIKTNTYSCSYSLIDSKGKTIVDYTTKMESNWDGITNFNFPKTLTPQPYLLTYNMENSFGRIGFSQWLYYTENGELTTNQKDAFAELFAQIATHLVKNDDVKEAVLNLENALLYAPNNLTVLQAVGKVYTHDEKYEEAIVAYEKALAIAPNNIQVNAGIALAYLSNEMTEKAIESYKKCMTLNPSDFIYYYEVGWIYNENKNYKEALSYLDRAVELNKDSSNTKPYEERILANNALKNYEAVIADYRSMLEYNPENWDYYYQIGYIQNDQGKYSDALISLNKAIELNDYLSDPIYERAYSYKKMGKFKDALKDFNTVLEMDKDDAPIKLYSHRGDCYWELGDKNKACDDYKKAVELQVTGAAEKLAEKCK